MEDQRRQTPGGPHLTPHRDYGDSQAKHLTHGTAPGSGRNH